MSQARAHHEGPPRAAAWGQLTMEHFFFFFSLMHPIGPELQISAHVAPCWCTTNFFFRLMHPIGPELQISAHVAPCWCTKNFFFLV